MADASTRTLVSVMLVAAGLVVPAVLIFVLSRDARWPVLADRYPLRGERPPVLVWLGYGVFRGWIGYNGGLVLTADEQGLYLSAMPVILSWCHAPIFIPWSEIREIRPRQRLWARLLEIHTAGAPEVEMAIHSGTFAPVRHFALAANVPGAY
jgi:hypothetical protein